MPISDWCCMYQVLFLQENFVMAKPMLQHYIEGRGHICMFLPKFHCELNPIEILWGYAKYRESFDHYIYYYSFFPGYSNISNGKFATAKCIVPKCLDMCNTLTIQKFFWKAWRYMDAYLYVLVFFIAVGWHSYVQYSKGLDVVQTAFAVKKYKSHWRVGLPKWCIMFLQPVH
jgi:hypothetical protein